MAESTQSRRIAKLKADAEKLFPLLEEKVGDAVIEEHLEPGDPFVVIDPARIVEIATCCRDDEALGFDLLSLISTVDYPDGIDALGKKKPPAGGDGTEGGTPQGIIEVVYILDSTRHLHRLVLKARLPREDPRLPSVEKVWSAADWHEREAFDLMGVVFEGHHNLVRILCAEDWEGHALRKDYVIPERYHGIKNIVY